MIQLLDGTFWDDPIANEYITYSADQLVFYQTDWDPDNGTITSWFKRGNMPSQASGRPSIVNINMEQLDAEDTVSVSVDSYEMFYDLTLNERERCIHIRNLEFPCSLNQIFTRKRTLIHLDSNHSSRYQR